MAVPPILHFIWRVLRRFLRPDFVFLVYGSPQDRSAYLPPAENDFFPPFFPIGYIRRGSRWGLVGATVLTIRDLVHNKVRVEKLLADASKAFPRAKTFALAGQLPGVCERSGVDLPGNFVSGVRGTVFAMCSASRMLAKKVGKHPSQITFALLGAGGTIGKPLIKELAKEFRSVVAFDPRYSVPKEEGNVLYTFEYAALASAEAVLVLTARGDDIQAYAHFFASGTHIADDTHPCMSADLRHQLESQGVVVWKATMADHQLKMYPRLPNFRSDDTPGCLLEAVVSLLSGADKNTSQEEFNKLSSKYGFEARLLEHPDK